MSDPDLGKPLLEEEAAADDAVIGRAFRLSLLALVVIAAGVAAVLLLGRSKPGEEVVIAKVVEAPAKLERRAAEAPRVLFTDVTHEAGIEFVHTNGARGDKLLPETMGSGAAFFDCDGDGDQDLLFVNSTAWPDAPRSPASATQALYRNDGSGRFEDVTAEVGLDVSLYGMGVAAADYDGDGDSDLFISAVGPNRLYRNDAGRFRDVTAEAGVAGEATAWSTSAGFLDYDRDGDLDLFVANYVRWSKAIDREQNFSLNGTDRAYGPPKNYAGSASYLYRNDGAGHFTDVSAEAGLVVKNAFSGEPAGKGLALAVADFDRDGLLDVFVANDTVQNFLFRNRGDGTFEELGAASGVAYDAMGNATGAMGVDVADYRNEDSLGLAIGNFANEASSLYVSQGRAGQFADMADVEGIGSPSRLHLSFGLFFFDYDLDGRLDLLQASGHLEETIQQVQPSQTYRQPAQLFWNAGPEARACFSEVEPASLGALSQPIVGRGAAYADIDGDGDLDVVLTQSGGAPLLLRNDQQLNHHWLRLSLRGRAPNRDAIGALVELEAGGVVQRRRVMPTRSYLSQVELPVTFGLGDASSVARLHVTWPDGSQQDVAVPSVDRSLEIVEAD